MMIWQEVAKIALTLISCVGGAGVIIGAVVKFSSDKIAGSLQKRYELKLNKELEEFKNKMQNKLYVSKTRFDVEFNVYRQLSESTVIMVKEVSQLFPRFTRDTRDEYEAYKAKYDTAVDKVIIAQDTLAINAPFISKDIYSKFDKIEKMCKNQLEDFIDFRLREDGKAYIEECREDFRNAYKRTKEVQNALNALLDELRIYLANLDVV